MSDFGNVAEVEVGGLDNELTWKSKERVESRITPWLHARGEGELSMVIEIGPVLHRVDSVPMRRSSVLSLLSLRKFWDSHVFIAEMQVSM